VGDRRLFNRFRKVLAENVYQKDFAQFLETTLAERDQRYRKFGGSPYMGEPNVKESAGGLRDIQTLTVTAGLSLFQGQYVGRWPLLMAGALVVTGVSLATVRRHVPTVRAPRSGEP